MAGAKRLALTHFDAGRYITLQERMDAVATVKGYEGIVVGFDGMVLNL
jgi:hypothetical protein